MNIGFLHIYIVHDTEYNFSSSYMFYKTKKQLI